MNKLIPQHNRSYNPVGPIGYFITFRTYGTWLHGDERGAMDRRNTHIPGTPALQPNQYWRNWETKQLKHPAVYFNQLQRSLVDHTIREVIRYNQWQLHALRVLRDHIHVVVTALKEPEIVMGSLKSWCTRRLRENKQLSHAIKPWSRHGSTRWLWTDDELKDACIYVNYRVSV